VENQSGNRGHVKILRSDNGGEYTSNNFVKYCAEKGISHEFTSPYSPEQNGVAERLNRTIMESVRSMIYHAGLPLVFLAKACSTAVYIYNRSPTTALKDKTPYECLFGRKTDISNLRVFGCKCYVHVPDCRRHK
jgi:transposase InsO family protein